MLTGKLDETLASKGNVLSEKLQVPLQKSLKELDTLLKQQYPSWKDKCGLVLTPARDGTIEWVLPEHVEEFKVKGVHFQKVEPSGADGEEEQSVPPGRTTGRSNSVEASMNLLSIFLSSNCQLGASQCRKYAEVLQRDGYDSIKHMRTLLEPTAVWPEEIKVGHRGSIVKELAKIDDDGHLLQGSSQPRLPRPKSGKCLLQ